jgi:hypothetical protein
VDGEADLAAENARLRVVIAKLREVITRQDAELGAARTRIAGQDAQIQTLAEQIAELSEQMTELRRRLGRDSKNSSMPPSAEGPAKKPATPRQRGARKPGKQPGTPGAHLAQTKVADEIVVHVPQTCAGCGEDLGDAPAIGAVRRQIFDLPEIGLRVTEHQAQRRRCGVRAGHHCGVSARGECASVLRTGRTRGDRLPASVAAPAGRPRRGAARGFAERTDRGRHGRGRDDAGRCCGGTRGGRDC